jgi:hypothetical protein
MSKSLTLAVVVSFSLTANVAFARDRAPSKKARPKTNVVAAPFVAPPVQQPVKEDGPKVEVVPASKTLEDNSVLVRVESDKPGAKLNLVEFPSTPFASPTITKLCEIPCSPKLVLGKNYLVDGSVSPYVFSPRSDMKNLAVKGSSPVLKNVGLGVAVGGGVLLSVAAGIASYASSSLDNSKRDYYAGKISIDQWGRDIDSSKSAINVSLGLFVAGGITLIGGLVVMLVAPGTDVKLNGGTKSASRVRPLANGFAF